MTDTWQATHRADSTAARAVVAALVAVVLFAAGSFVALSARHHGALASLRDTWLGADVSAVDGPPTVHVSAPRRLLPQPVAPAGVGGYNVLTQRDNRLIRWDPCQPIHYVVSGSASVLGADSLLRDAIAQASQATGLKFVYDGPTAEQATAERPAYQPGAYGPQWAPVLVAWTDPQQVPELGADVIGLGGPRVAVVEGQPRLVSGVVYLDGPQMRELVTRPDVSLLLENVMLHELGHMLGLDHVGDPSSVMYPNVTDAARYSAGDLRGLALLGSGPCYTTR